jgi:hypothetical protein
MSDVIAVFYDTYEDFLGEGFFAACPWLLSLLPGVLFISSVIYTKYFYRKIL